MLSFLTSTYTFFFKVGKNLSRTPVASPSPAEKARHRVTSGKASLKTVTPLRRSAVAEDVHDDTEAIDEDAELVEALRETVRNAYPEDEFIENVQPRTVRQQKLREDAAAKKTADMVRRKLCFAYFSFSDSLFF
jgi:hypothetical protein